MPFRSVITAAGRRLAGRHRDGHRALMQALASGRVLSPSMQRAMIGMP